MQWDMLRDVILVQLNLEPPYSEHLILLTYIAELLGRNFLKVFFLI